MTKLKGLKEDISTYQNLLALFGMIPLVILCIMEIVSFFHNGTFHYEYSSLVICIGIGTLLSLAGMMAMSHNYLFVILKHVNDYWADVMEHKILPKTIKDINDVIETEMPKAMYDAFEGEARELQEKYYLIKKDLIENYLTDVIEYQKILRKHMEEFKLLNERINKIIDDYESQNKSSKTK